LARRLERLNCGDWSGIDLGGLGVRYVALHRGLYLRNTAVPDRSWFAWLGLERHGYRLDARDGAVSVYTRGLGADGRPPSGEPDRSRAHFCQGWFGLQGGQVPMSEAHAPFWVYGAGELRLRVRAPQPLRTRFGVDGRTVLTGTISGRRRVVLPLGARRGWHVVTLDIPRLLPTRPRETGVRLLALNWSRGR